MGNSNTNVSSAVKEQAAGGTKALYKYIDLTGGGELVALMKTASRTKNFDKVDEVIVEGLRQFMYNPDGSTRIVHVSEVIAHRMGKNVNDIPKRPQDDVIIASHGDDVKWVKQPGKLLSYAGVNPGGGGSRGGPGSAGFALLCLSTLSFPQWSMTG